jgi:hypothetical protein
MRRIYRKFIIIKESDSKDEEENEGFTCLGHAVMKATDNALIHGEVIQSKVTEGQCELNEMRHLLKLSTICNALFNVKRDTEIRSRAILNSNNNIMNNSNNTNSTSHDNSTLTTSTNSNNNSNNLTTTTTISLNNSGNSNCNNTHNININVHDSRLNPSRPGFSLQEFCQFLDNETIMQMNSYQQQSLGKYQGYSSQVQGQQSLGMYHGYANLFLYHQDVSMPMFLSSETVSMPR